MKFEWVHEDPAHWDPAKAGVLGAAPQGALVLQPYAEGDIMAGEWWRVESGGAVVGYGWMDCTWGDAEILLAVAPAFQGQGAGTFILDHLEREAAARGLNYLFNEVREGHPHAEALTRWLRARHFEPSHDDRLLRRRVRA